MESHTGGHRWGRKEKLKEEEEEVLIEKPLIL